MTASFLVRAPLWSLAAAAMGWLSSWISVSLLGLPRDAFVLPYLVAGAALTVAFVHAAPEGRAGRHR